jgi:uncharacterized paraquat-inducible protein A
MACKKLSRDKVVLFIRISLLLASITFFVMGLIFPILHTKKHIIGITLNSDNVWLWTSIEYFFDAGEYFLGAIILTFTIIFPIIKYLDLSNRYLKIIPVKEKLSRILALTDKWSMLDVFIIALLIMNYKMDSSIITMNIQIGTTFFAISIILRMLVSTKLNTRYLHTKHLHSLLLFIIFMSLITHF